MKKIGILFSLFFSFPLLYSMHRNTIWQNFPSNVKKDAQKKNDVKETSFKSLPPELMDMIFEYIPVEHFNGSIAALGVLYTERMADKIETAFFTRLNGALQKIYSNSCRIQQNNQNGDATLRMKQDDRHLLDSICWHMVNFAQYDKNNGAKKRLAGLFKDVRKLNEAIPVADSHWYDIRFCCSNKLQNTDALDTEKINAAIAHFGRNSNEIWDNLHEETKKIINYSDFMWLRKLILHYFNLRLDDYCENNGSNFTLPLISFSSGGLIAVGGVLCKSLLVASSGVGCAMASIGLLLCLSNPEEENQCRHHDFRKIYDAKRKIIQQEQSIATALLEN